MAATKRVVLLGSTGSIGTQALEIVRANPDRFKVIGIAASGANPELLAAQALEFNVKAIAIANATAAQDVQLAIYAAAQAGGYAHGDFELPKLILGPKAAAQLAAFDCDVVVNGITGAVGLAPTLAAIEAGTNLALANKESLVVGGVLVTSKCRADQIIPVDSEHSALAQALRSGAKTEVRKLVLTASGGPFRGRKRDELVGVTAKEALNHPTWSMGPVVSVNSATMMNKGLEIIEAHLLFDIPMERIDVVVHPQSVVHSMVEFVDGSTIAQASPPDMKLPIALGMSWPERTPNATQPCDWTTSTSWTFEPVDEETFPAIALAKRVGTLAGSAPAAMNAANEEAVDAFLSGQIEFLDIVEIVTAVVNRHLVDGFVGNDTLTLEAVELVIDWAKSQSRVLIEATAAQNR